MDIKNAYDFYGPFQISNGKCYVKHNYVPFELGSLELAQVIENRINSLESELMKWVLLDETNRAEYNAKDEEHETTKD
jgi:hypothetical protein